MASGEPAAALLDTHALLWSLFAPERLSARARKLIEKPRVKLHVSAATLWEIALKHSKGKLNAPDALIDEQIARLGAVQLPITSRHVRTMSLFPADLHRDPFDRLLAAQSVAEQLPFITADLAFDKFESLTRFW